MPFSVLLTALAEICDTRRPQGRRYALIIEPVSEIVIPIPPMVALDNRPILADAYTINRTLADVG